MIFVWAAIFNWICAWKRYVRKVKAPSIGPIVGGVAGGASMIFFPLETVRHYAWVPPLVDIGCVPYVIAFTVIVPVIRSMRNRRGVE